MRHADWPLVPSAFVRALGYSLMPRIWLLSALPLLIMGAAAWAVGVWWWQGWTEALGARLADVGALAGVWAWLAQAMGSSGAPEAVASALLWVALTPVVVTVSLLLVAWLITPVVVRMVQARRFAHLQARSDVGLWSSVRWSVVSTLWAGLAFVLSLPLWLSPWLFMCLPPLIWGWLSYRVFCFDSLAEHATAAEREQLMRQHRAPLLTMGILSGFMGAIPALLWASGGWLTWLFAVVLLPVSIWLYTLVFAFTSLWFAHYLLQALDRLRQEATDVQEV